MLALAVVVMLYWALRVGAVCCLAIIALCVYRQALGGVCVDLVFLMMYLQTRQPASRLRGLARLGLGIGLGLAHDRAS